MPASSSTLTPPLASGVARLGFGELPLPALKARYGHPASGSRYVELDGFAVHYRDEGHPDQPVVVMMHGVVASLHTWDGWVKAFSRHYRVIRFDLPCFGLTGPAPGGSYYALLQASTFRDAWFGLIQYTPGGLPVGLEMYRQYQEGYQATTTALRIKTGIDNWLVRVGAVRTSNEYRQFVGLTFNAF